MPARLPADALRRGTFAGMLFWNAAYVLAAPVFWFFWTQRVRFRLPAWAELCAGFASGPAPVLVFAGAWVAAAVYFARGRRQAGGSIFNTVCALGLLMAASGMLVLVSAGLDNPLLR